ncbi:alpha/beta fold hydrolase [Balneolales bacterium ANBcel1]|nr:alpha/beta fold hydrolase [Balneolales bacterium ANBcel1]
MRLPAIHTIRYRGLRFEVTRHATSADRPDLLLLHGFLGSGRQFSHLIPALVECANPLTLDIREDVSSTGDTPSRNAELRASRSVDRDEDASLRSDSPFTAAVLVDGLNTVVTGLLQPRPFLAGYSMGGRLLLSWAARYPEAARGLILESTTPGIADPGKRAERIREDTERTKAIRRDYSRFLERWNQHPLFQPKHGGIGHVTGDDEPGNTPGRSSGSGNSHGEAGGALSHNASDGEAGGTLRNDASGGEAGDKLSHKASDGADESASGDGGRHGAAHMDAETAIRWLEGFGTGRMPPVWDQLHRIAADVLILTGASDRKFHDIGIRMKSLFRNARHVSVPGAAHRVHRDAPEAYVAHVRALLAAANR